MKASDAAFVLEEFVAFRFYQLANKVNNLSLNKQALESYSPGQYPQRDHR
jgi:hypothetical protein